MKNAQRLISVLLTAVILLGMVPVPSRAAETNAQVSNEDVTIQGTNGFGDLLSESIQQQYEEETEYSDAYSVTDLTITGNTAVVEYGAMEEAIVVVAIYSEDGLQMITSGKTTVSPDATEETVTISDLPEYFMASAFLVDTYDYSPLCDSYETPMYTREMQELLDSTIHDYEADRVLNLDNDETTNFAVYAEDTIIVEEKSGVNTIISVDDEAMTYVIGNADDTFLDLQPGDVVSYPYGEADFLFFKVAEIAVDGTTVTIQGEEFQLEDVFSHVKLEGEGSMADAAVDDSACEEGVSYGGMINEGTTYGLNRAFGGSDTKSTRQVVSIYKEWEEKPDSKVTIEGSLTYALEVTMDFYVSKEKQFIDFKNEVSAEVAIKFSGEREWKTPLPEFAIPVLPGVTVGFEPKLVLRVTGEVQVSAKLSFITGFTYTKEEGIIPVKSAGAFEMKAGLSANFFIGVDLCPNASVLNDVLCEFTATLPFGFLFELKEEGSIEFGGISPPQQHSCNVCVSFDVSGVISAGIEIQFLKVKWLKFERTLIEFKRGIGVFYYSVDHAKFGWGKCPYLEYLVTVSVQDQQGQKQANASVSVDGEEVGTTSQQGVLETYLNSGRHTITSGTAKRITEIKNACLIPLVLNEEKDDTGENTGGAAGVLGSIDSTTVSTGTTVMVRGTWGEGIEFTMYSDGLLLFRGNGVIEADKRYVTWYPGKENENSWNPGSNYREPVIKEIRFENGITGIGDRAFIDYRLVEKITIPDSVVTIGENSFYSSYVHTLDLGEGVQTIGAYTFNGMDVIELVIPDSVTSLGFSAFGHCDKLVSLSLGSGMKEIGRCAFEYCSSLTDLNLGETVEVIGDQAFEYCTGLTELVLPDSVVSIESGAFNGCTMLRDITWSKNLKSIGNSAFSGGYSVQVGLTHLELPDSLETLGRSAFRQCDNLETVTMGENITYIGEYAFEPSSDSKLKSVKIAGNNAHIDDYAFNFCENLTDVELGSVSVIDDCAFNYCTSLKEIVIPQSTTKIGAGAFTRCSSLESVVIGDEVTSVGDYAFTYCTSMKQVTFGKKVETIGYHAFDNNDSLERFIFTGNPPVQADVGMRHYVEAYFPADNENWKNNDEWERFLLFREIDSTGSLAWIPYTLDEQGNMIPGEVVQDSRYSPTAAAYEESANAQTEESVSPETEALEMEEPEESIWEVTERTEETQVETVIPAETTEPPTEATTEAVTAPTETELTYPEREETQDSLLFALLDSFAIKASAAEIETVAETTGEVEMTDFSEEPAANAIIGGDYSEENGSTYTVQIANFRNLVPNEKYVILALTDLDASDPLGEENLLYINQGVAAGNGTLEFRYMPVRDVDESYVVACGPSGKNLEDAKITFPEVQATGTLQTVHPAVIYDKKTLTEGEDYVILGQVSFTEPGEYTCFLQGINQYTGLVKCTYTVKGDQPESEVEYTYGQNAQIKLIEPWGIRANAKISTSAGVIDYSSLYDYGVYFIRKSALDRADLTQATITVEDIVNDADAQKQTKADGVIVSNGYLSAIYDNDIYTYELDDSVFVMFYFVTEEGQYPIYLPVRERNLKTLAEQRMNDAVNFPNQLEREVYQKMTKLEADVANYRSDFANLSAPEKQKAPTLAQYPLGAPAAGSSYSYGQNAQIKLIEPWGLKANVKVSQSGSVIDYNAVEEYGIVALADNSRTYGDASEILQNGNAYVFSSKNGDASISNGYISATYSKDIFTYQLNTDIYVFGYVKDADGYHYGPVRNRNVHTLMEARMNDAVNFPNVKERTVYTDMIELFEAITAYREDYFKN